MLTIFVCFISTLLLTSEVNNINKRKDEINIRHTGYIPSNILSATSLEFKGLVADFMFLRLTTFIGHKIILNEHRDQETHNITLNVLQKITDLDPRFWDPYVFAEAELVWGAGMVSEVEPLLEKAAKHLTNDYRPYYFLGFNRFYFLKDTVKASKYLRLAAQVPNCPDYIKNLAARLSLYANDTALGVSFLENLLATATSTSSHQYLSKRLEALKAILYLEGGVMSYYKDKKSKPLTVQDLLEGGYIEQIPQDPYGGQWVIMKNGRVYTTSKLIDLPKH